MIGMKILIFIIILIVLYLLALYPNMSRKDRMRVFHDGYIAHRGLFNNEDIPENSLKAFEKAVEKGYGVELDVQMTTDGKLVIFHDGSLLRMTGINKELVDCSYDELQGYPLLDTEERIPLFSDVLKVLKDTTLVVEIKPEGDHIATAKAVVEMMRDYPGYYCMESFHPSVVKYLKDHEPEILRGQLAYNYFKDDEIKLSFFDKVVASNLLLNFYNKPDFIAYDHRHVHNISFRILSKIYKAECVAWTVQSQNDLEKAKEYFQTFIFDSFEPKE